MTSESLLWAIRKGRTGEYHLFHGLEAVRDRLAEVASRDLSNVMTDDELEDLERELRELAHVFDRITTVTDGEKLILIDKATDDGLDRCLEYWGDREVLENEVYNSHV